MDKKEILKASANFRRQAIALKQNLVKGNLLMTLNIALQQEQQQRLQESLTASQEQVYNEAGRNRDLYSAGDFDGLVGIEPDPEKWGEYAYRSGFITGVTRHYDEKYQMSLNNEPF